MSFTLLPQTLTDSDDDWIETVRGRLYPKLHNPLVSLGELIGVKLYATGLVRWNQYVGLVTEDEEAIEAELSELGAKRNPIACLKRLPDGRESEGSWVLLHEDAPDIIAEGRQLHFTLFDSEKGAGREIYAHYEDDWRTAPLAHLRAKHFSARAGVRKAKTFFDESTFLNLKHTEQRHA